jgi:hypothetical protein
MYVDTHHPLSVKGEAAQKSGAARKLLIFGIVFLAAGVIGGYGDLVFSSIRNSNATLHAVQLATANKDVSQFLGSSVQAGYFVTGNIYDHGDGTGNANLSIFLKGSNGSGTVYANEREINNNWYADKLTFRPDGDLTMIVMDESTRIAQLQPE